MKTLEFELTTGVIPGYGNQLSDENLKITLDEFASNYQKLATEVFDETGVYLSGRIHETRTVYQIERGCPSTGEQTFTIEGLLGPCQYESEWKKAVVLLTRKIKEFYKQERVYLIVRNVSEYIHR